MTLWTAVVLSGALTWQAGAQTQSILPAMAHPVGTVALCCLADARICETWECVEHVWTSGPATGKTRAWKNGETVIPWFVPSAPGWGEGSTVQVVE